MQNKKMRNIEILAVIILATTLFMGSAYVIVSDNYRSLLYKPKEKKLMAEQYYANEAKRIYQWSVHEQNMADIRHFLDEKFQRLDSMRNIHYQIENDFLYKADSCYKLSKLYKDKIDEMNDSIVVASGVEADTSNFVKQKQKYIKKRNLLLKQSNQYTEEAFQKYEQHNNLRDSILYHDNYVLKRE